jgi:OFA family oxalate/formate antiporter-like MFS transporter
MNYDSKRWLFLVLCFICNGCAGIVYAWSVFIKPIVNQFQWSVADVSLSFTLMLALGSLVPVLAGKLQEHIQPRIIILTGGVAFGSGLIGLSYTVTLTELYVFSAMAGLGLSLVYPAGTISNIVKFFPDKRGLASGLLTGGASLGAVAWAPASVMMIERVGLLSTFKYLGIAFMVTIVLASLFIEAAPQGYRPREMAELASADQEDGTSDINWSEMLKNPLFYLLAGIFLAVTTSGMMLFGQVSLIAQDVVNVSPQFAAGIVGLLAIANTAGRLCWGWISDILGRFPVIFIQLIILAAAMLGLTQATSHFAFASMVMLVGLCYGGFLAIMAPLLADLFGSKYLAVNFGLMFLMVGAGALIGPRLAAVMREATDSYTQAFIIAAMLNLAGILLTLFAKFVAKRSC